MVYSSLSFVWLKLNTMFFFNNFASKISYFITLQVVWKRHFWILMGVLMFVLIVLQRQDMDSLKRSLLSLKSIVCSEIDNITLTSISNYFIFTFHQKISSVKLALHTVQYFNLLMWWLFIVCLYTAALVTKISSSFCIDCSKLVSPHLFREGIQDSRNTKLRR